METAFTELVGCQHPLQQAGMGGTATPDLVVAVALAGALGMLGTPMGGPELLAAQLDDVLGRTAGSAGAIGVNFLMPFLDRAAVEVAAPLVSVAEFFYGEPDSELVDAVHQGGALACWQVGSAEEARRAADVGCDLVVAQGNEAGGHVRGERPLWSLLDDVLDALEIPVVAAGGIGTARAMAAALAGGAAAVRVGTRFVTTYEADAHLEYQQALIDARPEDTVLTTAFSVMWPDAPHRVLASSIEAASSTDAEIIGELPVTDGMVLPVPRWSPFAPTRASTGNLAAMAHYAGTSVSAVRRVQPASEVVAELVYGAAALLGRAPH